MNANFILTRMPAAIFLACLLMAHLVQGQFSKDFKAGSYVLTSNPNTRLYAGLKLRNERKLIIKATTKKTYRAKSNQIANFRINGQQYVVVKDFQFVHNSVPVKVKAAFVAQLDSGSIVLMRYNHLLNTGVNWLFLYRYPIDLYLVSTHPGSAPTIINNYFDKSRFREEVRPFLTARPDLITFLEEGQLTYYNFPDVIHALNNNLPFDPSKISKPRN